MVADFAEKFSVGRKFKELSGSGGIRRSSRVAAGKDEDVALRIDGDASGFAEINIRRKFQEIGDGVEANFGRLLGEKRSGGEKEQNKKGALHLINLGNSLSSSRIIRGFDGSVAH
jgi:hypothetical protein